MVDGIAGGMTLSLKRGLAQNSSHEAPIAAPQRASRIVPQITFNPLGDAYGRNSFLVPVQDLARYHGPEAHMSVGLRFFRKSGSSGFIIDMICSSL
jgi:hypothetical protein